MNKHIKRLLYLFEYDNRVNKKAILENIDAILESKQTEQQALAILKKGGVSDNFSLNIINQFRRSDTSKNQLLIPIMAKAFLEAGANGLPELLRVFVSLSEMLNSNKINTPQISDAGYIIGNKTFSNYLKLAEFVHGLEHMSKGHAEWKGKINLETNEPPLWEGNGIQVYDGNDVGKCIKYTTGGLTGKHYGFCIGQPANTMWQSYRDTKTSTFNYVIDSNRDLSDPLHIVVVDATERGIELTDANNSTGNIGEYSDDTDAYLKYLQSKGVPTDKLFYNKPKTPEEEKETEKLEKANRDINWFKQLGFEEKSKYIGRGHLLSDDQFKYLWDFKNDKGGFHLLHQYLDTGQAIPEEQFNILVGEKAV
jgi:hypothetical protein